MLTCMSYLRRFGSEGPSFVLHELNDLSAEEASQLGTQSSCLSEPLARQLFSDGKSTFALLDAAHMMGLQEILAASDLTNRCLFTGDALDELGDVAPWLVRLSPDSKLARQLFTKGDASWDYWGRPVGLYLTSDWGFDEVWTHLRRYTRITQQGSSKSFFWRFWEPAFWFALAQLANSTWVDEWPLSFCRPFKRINFIHGDIFHSIDLFSDDHRPAGPSAKLTMGGLAVLQLVMARPALAVAFQRMQTNNWIVPYTSYFARHAQVPDAEINALMQLDPTRGKRFICEGLLSNISLPPHYVARGLQHVLRSGRAT